MSSTAQGAIAMDALRGVADFVLPGAVHFFTDDLPAVLTLISQAFQRKHIPTSVDGWLNLNTEQKLELLPCIAAILVFSSLPFFLLRGDTATGYSAARRPSRSCVAKRSYWLTRVALLRALGVVYLSAFATSALQVRGLFGSNGLAPADFAHSSRPTPVFQALLGLGIPASDCVLELVSWTGVLLSLVLATSSVTTALVPAALWLLYLSLVNGGTMMINYGWEWLTLELGFLGIFLCPLLPTSLSSWWGTSTPTALQRGALQLQPRSGSCPGTGPGSGSGSGVGGGGLAPPRLVLWLFRWCAFRLLIGAGMSKVPTRTARVPLCRTARDQTRHSLARSAARLTHSLSLSLHLTCTQVDKLTRASESRESESR